MVIVVKSIKGYFSNVLNVNPRNKNQTHRLEKKKNVVEKLKKGKYINFCLNFHSLSYLFRWTLLRVCLNGLRENVQMDL